MKVRSKISFMALEKRVTIAELFFFTILRVYDNLRTAELVPPEDEETDKKGRVLVKKMSDVGTMKGFLSMIMAYNETNLIEGLDDEII